MSVDSAQTKILNALEDLNSENFEKFLFKLTDRSAEPFFRTAEVENKSRVQITQLLVTRCTESGAVERAVRALRDSGCNNGAQELEQWNKKRLDKDRPALRYTSRGLLDLNPTPEARSAVTNRKSLGNVCLNVQGIQDEHPKDLPLTLGRLTFGQYRGRSLAPGDHQPCSSHHQPGTSDHQPGTTDHQPGSSYFQRRHRRFTKGKRFNPATRTKKW